MIPFADRAVKKVFASYPDNVRLRMLALRDLIFTTAQHIGVAQDLVESLKWGEPSYTCPTGSTVRIHWKVSSPDLYKIFFHCQTKLVPTFRELYPNDFDFEGNRAIRFQLSSDPNFSRLGSCIEMCLNYHRVKHLPGLGNPAEETLCPEGSTSQA